MNRKFKGKVTQELLKKVYMIIIEKESYENYWKKVTQKFRRKSYKKITGKKVARKILKKKLQKLLEKKSYKITGKKSYKNYWKRISKENGQGWQPGKDWKSTSNQNRNGEDNHKETFNDEKKFVDSHEKGN